MSDLYLEHHGVLGMHWGVRRYQNPDGTLTAMGKKRRTKLSDATMVGDKLRNEQRKIVTELNNKEEEIYKLQPEFRKYGESPIDWPEEAINKIRYSNASNAFDEYMHLENKLREVDEKELKVFSYERRLQNKPLSKVGKEYAKLGKVFVKQFLEEEYRK